MAPYTPYLVFGTVINSIGSSSGYDSISFTTSLGTMNVVANSSGLYVVDLSGIGYVIGDTVKVSVQSRFNNESSISTFVIGSLGSTTHNVTTSVREIGINTTGYTVKSMLHNVGNNPVTADNPLPVASSEIDLVNNPSTVWTIVRGDGQPDSETITIRGVSYKRTFTYTGDNMTARSAWVRL